MNDAEFLRWIYERMAHVHNENKNYDYMLRLQRIISTMDGQTGGVDIAITDAAAAALNEIAKQRHVDDINKVASDIILAMYFNYQKGMICKSQV